MFLGRGDLDSTLVRDGVTTPHPSPLRDLGNRGTEGVGTTRRRVRRRLYGPSRVSSRRGDPYCQGQDPETHDHKVYRQGTKDECRVG